MDNSELRLILKWLLERNIRAVQRKRQLEERLARISAERDAPLRGHGYSPLPRGGGDNEGAASIIFRMAEIEDQIYNQQAEVGSAILQVMGILEVLPALCVEREILELKYIDRRSWRQIGEAIPMSRGQVSVHFNRGLDMLLTDERVRGECEKNRDAYRDWAFRRDEAIRKSARAKKQSGGYAPEIQPAKKPQKKKRRR